MNIESGLSQRLEHFLASLQPGRAATVTSYRPLIGGYSRVTALAEVKWDDGTTEKLVLRSDPPSGEGVFASDRDPEWDLLLALSDRAPFEIPRPRWYDATGSYFGTKCIVMDHCEGVPLQSTIQNRADLTEATAVFLDVAAALQRTPLDVLPPDMERPPDWDTYLESAIEIYERAEREVPGSSPVIRFVCAWLRANRPEPVPLGLVHGDFQPGNILVADGRPPVVIDWEFTRIGDPREDIGYYSQNPLSPNLYGADPEGFLAGYRARTGFSESQVNVETMQYFFILGMAKLFAQILEGTAALAAGRSRGIMNAFLINAMCYFQDEYLRICSRPNRERAST